MVTSKSTVLGLRLDHERRAWVESEAAEQGVTVRVLFERMIDRARADEAEPEATPGSGPAPASSPVPSGRPGDGVSGTGVNTAAAAATSPLGDWASSSGLPPWGSSQPSDLARLVALPGEMIHAGVFVATTVIGTSGRCVRWSWQTCTAPMARCGRASSGAPSYLP